ncbi:sugar transferase [Thiomicrospira microaerophila]|uniref:sugar transferase n=1 Tax=Thiomicrospira microaerophila TaxID=406020 RepID=UPI00200E4800|nr:sugar transferase [Thiomicrospira microaerophila]UQB43358.1 sugar transferase [Thiomicrospira microaerophila]
MKRVFDVFLILLSLPLLLPLLVVVALLVRVKLGAPVLFWQVRPGLASGLFKMADHCFFVANCYNRVNITATPIEEAQPWRFFIASKKVLDA